MVQATEHCHIVADGQIPSGGPVIKGTHTPARAIGELWWLGVLAGDQAAGPVSSTQVFDTLVAAAIEPRSTPTWSATGFRIC
jgi:uncharacterized protein (DUF433 family)